jgi:hypothetical protein
MLVSGCRRMRASCGRLEAWAVPHPEQAVENPILASPLFRVGFRRVVRDTTPSLLVLSAAREVAVAKGIEKGKKENKPKVSIKEKQKKKKEKKAGARVG